tara:strand:- start:210 stop:377 length:168 start_codon:yes stop_codon:yes gene_type:complete
MSKKKTKKIDKLQAFVEQKVRQNEQYCRLNDDTPSPYMNGVNSFCAELLKYIDKL